MCWNAPVSLGFGLLGLACAAFLFHVGRKAEADPGSLSAQIQPILAPTSS